MLAFRRANVFIVMLGSKTRHASEVRKEVATTNWLGKQRFQIIGRYFGVPGWAVPNGGRVCRWN